MKRLQGFICGFLAALVLLISIPALAATIDVIFNPLNIVINGVKATNKGENYTLANGNEVPFSIVYKGTTYLPLRKLSELMGKDLYLDSETDTVYLSDPVVTYDPKEEFSEKGGANSMDIDIDSILKDILGDPGEVPLNKYGLPDFTDYAGEKPILDKSSRIINFTYNGVKFIDLTSQRLWDEGIIPDNYIFSRPRVDGKLQDNIQFIKKDLETNKNIVLIEEVPYAKYSIGGYYIPYDYFTNTVLPLTK